MSERVATVIKPVLASRRRLPAGREVLLLATLAVLVGLISLGSHGAFWSRVNLDNLFVGSAITVIPAIGMTVVILTGGIDVSTGSVLGLTAAIGGTCFAAGWSLAATVPIFLASGAVLGLINALLIINGRIPPVIATLGTLSIYRMLVFIVLGSNWITAIPPALTTIFVVDHLLFLPVVAVIALVFLIGAALFLRHFRWGRHVYALGNNEEAARLAGIRPERIKLAAYVMLGLLTGFAALLTLGQSPMVQTSTGSGFVLQVIAAVVLGGTALSGGRGTMLGTLLGTLVVQVVDDGIVLLRIQPFWGGVALGAVILAAIGLSAHHEIRGA
ncbi:ABC transporter permease [Acidiphilium sp. AL]|uniref:Autoinducer 2 import system permease protein LsrC n=1 Tax=Acidiphilium iwatense TaxID=768198 RepID=A0ABS9DU73_9PROT|nr:MULTISPECIES: ABC transporter permease [Acidiphilium]MCF3946275.1 ABC transporter permease [Acidiphilium iwatense]MCU4158847.1 ABC transporter permease [Acidiphilium sp. AL]